MKTLEKVLENQFGLYLQSKNVSAISQKNYLSDLRHFLGWFILVLKSKSISVDHTSPSSLCSFITQELVNRYKTFLTLNQVAQKTANRRLSTLRKFCSFCLSQGWLEQNPAKKVANIGMKKDPVEQIVKKFGQSLNEEGTSKVTIKNYLSDIRQFLTWTEGVN